MFYSSFQWQEAFLYCSFWRLCSGGLTYSPCVVAAVHHPHAKTFCLFYRWWWWWICPLSIWHFKRCVCLWWWSYGIFDPGRGSDVPSTLGWWGFTARALVIPAPEHFPTPGSFTHSPGLWTARVSSSRRGPGHLELQEGKRRGALWTIWRRTQVFS